MSIRFLFFSSPSLRLLFPSTNLDVEVTERSRLFFFFPFFPPFCYPFFFLIEESGEERCWGGKLFPLPFPLCLFFLLTAHVQSHWRRLKRMTTSPSSLFFFSSLLFFSSVLFLFFLLGSKTNGHRLVLPPPLLLYHHSCARTVDEVKRLIFSFFFLLFLNLSVFLFHFPD